MRVIHFRLSDAMISQPRSRVRSVWIFELPLGNEIQRIESGLRARAAFGASLSSSALLCTKIWIQSKDPVSDAAAGSKPGNSAASYPEGAWRIAARASGLRFIFRARELSGISEY